MQDMLGPAWRSTDPPLAIERPTCRFVITVPVFLIFRENLFLEIEPQNLAEVEVKTFLFEIQLQ